ncbi:MAG: transglycosylase SLT domain-containing protein [Dysgonamonadaceae bacterium]|jgi:membrane-bound lytic murein transglycosylase D|nr:transglycosylase SLT domain-containing protein [Dysgonamonadaceae bacterium]
MKRKYMFLSACLLCGLLNVSAQHPALRAKDTIRDNAVVQPEVLNQQLATLLHDWQLDLSKSKNECSQGANVVFADTVYANRLYKLPSEMELSYNQVVRSQIDLYSNRRREIVGYMLALGDYYFPMFEEALDRYGLPLELKYLPVIESALNPVAVSRAGATGLWQFMLKTGKLYGLEVNSLVDERRDPYKATDAACRYLKFLYETYYHDWNLVIAAYNCGPGTVNKAIARSGGKNDYWQIYYRLPRETRGYVPIFIAATYIMNYHNEHNICPVESYSAMRALDTIHVNKEIHFAQIAPVLDIPIEEIRRLNPQFKKDIIPGNYKTYALVLPTNKTMAFIDKENEILNYNKNKYLAHRLNTDEFVREEGLVSDGTSVNVYYRVRKGDTLSKIAQLNGVSLAQLKSWNGMSSTKLSIGRRLIVKKRKVAPAPPPQPEQTLAQNKNTVVDSTATTTAPTASNLSSGGVIAEYFKKQSEQTSVESVGQNKLASAEKAVEKVEEAQSEEKQPETAAETAAEKSEEKQTEPQDNSLIVTQNKVYYKIREGDSLLDIAQRRGVSVEQLKSWNGLKHAKLTAGKYLIVGKKEEISPGT